MKWLAYYEFIKKEKTVINSCIHSKRYPKFNISGRYSARIEQIANMTEQIAGYYMVTNLYKLLRSPVSILPLQRYFFHVPFSFVTALAKEKKKMQYSLQSYRGAG